MLKVRGARVANQVASTEVEQPVGTAVRALRREPKVRLPRCSTDSSREVGSRKEASEARRWRLTRSRQVVLEGARKASLPSWQLDCCCRRAEG